MANPHRQAKLGVQIANEVSDLIRTRIKDPRVGFASITHVEVSGDLRHAKVFVSVMGEDEDKKGTMEALVHAAGFIRHELAGRLTLRFMPAIIFKQDESIERGSHILGLIREMEEQGKQGSSEIEEEEPADTEGEHEPK